MNNSPKESFDFLGLRWGPWSTADSQYFITMAFATIVFFGGYLVARWLINGKWERRLNAVEYALLMMLTIFVGSIMRRVFFLDPENNAEYVCEKYSCG